MQLQIPPMRVRVVPDLAFDMCRKLKIRVRLGSADHQLRRSEGEVKNMGEIVDWESEHRGDETTWECFKERRRSWK